MSKEFNEIKRAEKILIYGAARNAADAILYMGELFPEKITGCAVTSMEDNNRAVWNVPVRIIDEYERIEKKNEIVVLVSLRPEYFDEINENLQGKGFKKNFLYGDENDLMTEIHDFLLNERGYSNKFVLENELLHNRIKTDLINLQRVYK